MQEINAKIGIATTLLAAALLFSPVSSAVTVTGIAVSSGGSTGPAVGIPAAPDGTIEYFIPLRDNEPGAVYVGTYGDTPTDVFCDTPDHGIGTCSDEGSGFGYDTAGALEMNIFFDLAGEPDSVAGDLIIHFADLDLDPVNDPTGFEESLTFAYWDKDGSGFTQVGETIKDVLQLTDADFPGATTDLDPPLNDDDDPFTWTLDLLALGILDDVNHAKNTEGGFWISLGFGSRYLDKYGNPKHGHNTSEFLTATLDVSPVPIPSAVWLFGSALIGFIGLSRRTRV